jgi:hypothetical protein
MAPPFHPSEMPCGTISLAGDQPEPSDIVCSTDYSVAYSTGRLISRPSYVSGISSRTRFCLAVDSRDLFGRSLWSVDGRAVNPVASTDHSLTLRGLPGSRGRELSGVDSALTVLVSIWCDPQGVDRSARRDARTTAARSILPGEGRNRVALSVREERPGLRNFDAIIDSWE